MCSAAPQVNCKWKRLGDFSPAGLVYLGVCDSVASAANVNHFFRFRLGGVGGGGGEDLQSDAAKNDILFPRHCYVGINSAEAGDKMKTKTLTRTTSVKFQGEKCICAD